MGEIAKFGSVKNLWAEQTIWKSSLCSIKIGLFKHKLWLLKILIIFNSRSCSTAWCVVIRCMLVIIIMHYGCQTDYLFLPADAAEDVPSSTTMTTTIQPSLSIASSPVLQYTITATVTQNVTTGGGCPCNDTCSSEANLHAILIGVIPSTVAIALLLSFLLFVVVRRVGIDSRETGREPSGRGSRGCGLYHCKTWPWERKNHNNWML